MSARDVGRTCLVLTLAIGVACSPRLSDTGPIGTWRRTIGDHGRAELAFWKAGDGSYRFRANRFGAEGAHELRCGTEGPCLEYGTGTEPYYEYRYHVFERPGESGLFVECEGVPRGTGQATPLHQIEQFTVAPGGRVLEARLVEQNRRAGNPAVVRARYHKVSDDPFE